MIKIMHIITDTNIGGGGRWLLNYLSGVDRSNYEVSVVIPENSLLKPFIEDLGVKYYEIEGIADCSFSKIGTKRLYKLFKEVKPDIVHSHASLSARIAARQVGKIKIVNTRHCIEPPKKGIKKTILAAANNFLSDTVIGVSELTCQNLINEGINPQKVRLVYNGVAPQEESSMEQRTELKKKLNIPPENKIVGIVARLEGVKNHDLFVGGAEIILKKRKDVTFLIVGGGSAEEHIRTVINERGLSESIIMTGNQKEVAPFLNIFDVNVLTSKSEALSLSLIEGMLLGIPAVTTASGGPQEVVDDGETGYIVKNNDAKLLAEGILKILDNPEIGKKMGQKGKQKAQEIFGIEKMLKALDEIYSELIKSE